MEKKINCSMSTSAIKLSPIFACIARFSPQKSFSMEIDINFFALVLLYYALIKKKLQLCRFLHSNVLQLENRVGRPSTVVIVTCALSEIFRRADMIKAVMQFLAPRSLQCMVFRGRDSLTHKTSRVEN